MAMNNDAAEMEAFQSLSDKWHPGMDQLGPLIGSKQGMDVLVTEYSQADPAYVVKTTGLAVTHDSYRPVKGDGQCGWRATVFSYFEILLLAGDPSLVQQEKIRFETYADTMRMVGIEYDLMVDMFDYTWELFDAVMHATQQQSRDEKIILNILNDENKSNSIVYHFKMVTSAFMKLREDDYAPFTENFNVDEYRVRRIDPTNEEIDQIGLQVLTDAVIKPAGLGLEVLYLDRSMGDVVTPHNFTPDSQGVPVIKLLYRPGHYDIIYQGQQQPQVYLQYSQYDPQEVEAQDHLSDDINNFMGTMFSAPPTAYPSYQSNSLPVWTNAQPQQDPYFQPYDPYQHVQYLPTPVYPASQIPIPPPTTIHAPRPIAADAAQSRNGSASSRSATLSPSPVHIASNAPQDPFRQSNWQFQYNSRSAQQPAPTQRAGVLNNSSSTANNPAYVRNSIGAFQPHQYDPSTEYTIRRNS